jgi:phosphatidate cytidylyltransferase
VGIFNETVRRILVALIAVPIAIYALFFIEELFLLIVVVASILMALELLSIAEVKSIRVHKDITVVFTALIPLLTYLIIYDPWRLTTITNKWNPIIFIIILSTVMVFTIETFKKDFKHTLETVSIHIFTLIYCGVLISFLLKLQDVSPYYLLFIWVVTWMTDTGAYFVGKYLGRHKLNLKSSPNKTLEGFIGGVCFAVISGVLLKLSFPIEYSVLNNPLFSFEFIIITSFIFSVISIFGDLAESILKRSSGIKDSKTYIPGHGGMLDVIDSLVYTAPIFYYLIVLFE